jgi:hypothetical protein
VIALSSGTVPRRRRIYTRQVGCKLDEQTFEKFDKLCKQLGVRRGVMLKLLVEFLVNNLSEIRAGTKVVYLHLRTGVVPVPRE